METTEQKTIEEEIREVLEDRLREKAKEEKGCCFYIYGYIVKWFLPFSKLGL
jgi:hypothetical protein